MRYTQRTLDDSLAINGFGYIGTHSVYRIYGNGYDRKAYIKRVGRGGIGYELLKSYKTEQYTPPVEMKLSDLIDKLKNEVL